MFKGLKEKLSGWFKKKPDVAEEEKDKEVKAKAEKKKESKVVEIWVGSKEVKKKETKAKLREEILVEPEKFETEKIIGKPVLVEKKEEEDVGFFVKIKKRLTESVLTQEQFDEAFEELEMTLLENNVALVVVDKIHDSLSKGLVNVAIKKGDVEKKIIGSLKDSILEVLVEGEDVVARIKESKESFVVLFFGINGSGKTTSIAKFASRLKAEKISCVLGAADTFRAAAVEQLEKHASKIGVPIVKGEYGVDPSSVAFETLKYAKKNKIQAVLIDTAGRMYTQGNLMREMEKIVRVAKPNLKIFVGESITGNDAVSQAQSFNDVVGIDGIILTKADVDEKAGTILSVGFVTGKPILFLGMGQDYEDLKEFKKEDVLKGLGLD